MVLFFHTFWHVLPQVLAASRLVDLLLVSKSESFATLVHDVRLIRFALGRQLLVLHLLAVNVQNDQVSFGQQFRLVGNVSQRTARRDNFLTSWDLLVPTVLAQRNKVFLSIDKFVSTSALVN